MSRSRYLRDRSLTRHSYGRRQAANETAHEPASRSGWKPAEEQVPRDHTVRPAVPDARDAAPPQQPGGPEADAQVQASEALPPTRAQLETHARFEKPVPVPVPVTVTVTVPVQVPAQSDVAAPAASEQTLADEREARRRRILKAGLICCHGRSTTLPCTVRDISDEGARIMVSGAVSPPDRFELFIELDGSWAECVVAWRRGNVLGVHFDAPLKVERPTRRQVVEPTRPADKPSLRRKAIP